jgi:hypothetical protein
MARIVAAELRQLAPVGFDVMMMVMIVLAVRAVHVFVLIVRRVVVRMRFVFGHNFGHSVCWGGILHRCAAVVMNRGQTV